MYGKEHAVEVLRECFRRFDYGSALKHGKLVCKETGRVCGGPRNSGTKGHKILAVNILGRKYLVHRVIWLFIHSTWPTHKLKFKDGNGFNCHIDNLELMDKTRQKAAGGSEQ